MLGEIATADWDMFHSRHPFAEMHAAARAVSGGPIYVSDSPGNHNPELLRKLVLSDGTILRPNLPSRPTADCLFNDVMSDGVTALKVWSLNDVSAVVGMFNVQGSHWDRTQRRYVHDQNYPPRPVRTKLRPRDVGGDFTEPLSALDAAIEVVESATGITVSTPTSKFIAWSAKNKKMTLLKDRNSVIDYDLKHKDWEVVSISKVYQIDNKKSLTARIFSIRSELKNSNNIAKEILWSPIGMLDMMNCGGAVMEIIGTKTPMTGSFKVRGPGVIGLYANTKPKKITVDGKDVEFVTDKNNDNNNDNNDLLISFKLVEKEKETNNKSNDRKISIDTRVVVITW
jgi:raffinose synthase